MINVSKNSEINKDLQSEYEKVTLDYLKAWSLAFESDTPPCRINEFGIVDESRYDTDNGILFIGKETNGWKDEDFNNNCLFRNWMKTISINGLPHNSHIKKHPTMWYNIGRWATLILDPNKSLIDIANMREDAISSLGLISFTNINKVRGNNVSGKEYEDLTSMIVVNDLLTKEIKILNPTTIVCCGTYSKIEPIIQDFKGKIIKMPHPAARKTTLNMLEELQSQIKRQETI